jgi:hypothetical protein
MTDGVLNRAAAAPGSRRRHSTKQQRQYRTDGHHEVACTRPRMMNSAKARMHYPLLLVDCPVSAAVAVGVGQQGQEAGALDSGGQLTLITSFGTGDTAGTILPVSDT